MRCWWCLVQGGWTGISQINALGSLSCFCVIFLVVAECTVLLGEAAILGGSECHEWRVPRFPSRTLYRVVLMFWLIGVYCTFTPIASATVGMESMINSLHKKDGILGAKHYKALV